MQPISITGFKAYDLRGRIPDELNEDVAYRVGRAYAEFVKPKKVIVGRDIRLSSELLGKALEQGLLDSGVDVYDIGLCGTEVVYFATFFKEMDGGIMVTASHNPPDYNGMKFVREGSRPISGDTGLQDIRQLAEEGRFTKPARVGERFAVDIMPEYLQHLLSYVDRAKLKPLKVVVHAGNGGAGLIVDKLEPVPAVQVHQGASRTGRHVSEWRAEPDAGRESPRTGRSAAQARRRLRDFSGTATTTAASCSTRTAVSSRAITSSACWRRRSCSAFPGSRIVHDPRLTWNTLDIVAASRRRGRAVQIGTRVHQGQDARSGRRLRRRDERAPLFPRVRLLRQRHDPVAARDAADVRSAARNCRNSSASASGCSPRVARSTGACPTPRRRSPRCSRSTSRSPKTIDHTDGVSVEFDQWRFNLRSSNTEPLIRLNVESRGNEMLMRDKTAELLALVGGEPG